MASLLDFLTAGGWSPDQVRGGGLLGNLQPRQQGPASDQGGAFSAGLS